MHPESCYILKILPKNRGTIVALGGIDLYNFRKILVSMPIRAGFGSFFNFWRRFSSSPDSTVDSITADIDDLDYVIFHAGGRRVADKLDKENIDHYNEEFFDFALSIKHCVSYFGLYDNISSFFPREKYIKLLEKSLSLGLRVIPTVRSYEDIKDGFIFSNFDIVGIPDEVTYPNIVQLYGNCKNNKVKVHLFNLNNHQVLRNFSIYSASTYNWLGGRWYGNTYYFDNAKLKTHPTYNLSKIRRSMYPLCQKYGLDHAKILSDVNKKTPYSILREIDKLNIASFIEYEKFLQFKVGYWNV